MVKALSYQCRGLRFHPWWELRSHVLWSEAKKKKQKKLPDLLPFIGQIKSIHMVKCYRKNTE